MHIFFEQLPIDLTSVFSSNIDQDLYELRIGIGSTNATLTILLDGIPGMIIFKTSFGSRLTCVLIKIVNK
jgi:hypothetical protein